jgi:hypothetical protein
MISYWTSSFIYRRRQQVMVTKSNVHGADPFVFCAVDREKVGVEGLTKNQMALNKYHAGQSIIAMLYR